MIKTVSLGCPRPLSQKHSEYFLLVFILFPHYLVLPNLHVVIIPMYSSFAIIVVLLFKETQSNEFKICGSALKV